MLLASSPPDINRLRSCGFYITAINADKRIPQDEQCGGLYCETTPFTCSSEYNITYSCTNTTYLDNSGNAQGITLFVATDCNSNERLSLDGQDPRYDSFEMGQSVLATLFFEVINATEPDVHPQDDPYYFGGTSDPAVLPTCLRGCLCGYSGGYDTGDATVYPNCFCQESLANIFYYLTTALAGDDLTPTVYTTPNNLSLLLQYGIYFDDFNATLVSLFQPYYGMTSWVNISEGSNLTLQKGFECFGDYQTISEIMPPLP